MRRGLRSLSPERYSNASNTADEDQHDDESTLIEHARSSNRICKLALDVNILQLHLNYGIENPRGSLSCLGIDSNLVITHPRLQLSTPGLGNEHLRFLQGHVAIDAIAGNRSTQLAKFRAVLGFVTAEAMG
jgi:hypothetical protein